MSACVSVCVWYQGDCACVGKTVRLFHPPQSFSSVVGKITKKNWIKQEKNLCVFQYYFRLPGTGNSHWMKLNEKQFKTWTIDTSEFQIQCFGGQWNIWTDGVVKYYVILSNRWDLDIVINRIVYDLLEKKSRDNSTANLVHARHEWSRGVCSTTSFLAVFWNRKKWSPGKSWK